VSAGLPGLGLGGLFFIFSALLAPFRQLFRTVTGRSRAGDWSMIGRQFAQATVMVAAVDLSLRLAYVAIAAAGLGYAPSAVSATVIPLTLIGITSALLVGVLATAKVAEIAVRLRPAELPRLPDVMPRVTPLRTLVLSGVVAVAWIALLAASASELSPLELPREGTTAQQRGDDGQGSKSNSARSQGLPRAEALSEPASASSRVFDSGQPVAEPGHEPNSAEGGNVPQPTVSPHTPPGAALGDQQQTPSAPADQDQAPSATPGAGVPAPPPASPGSASPPVTQPPEATGPPASAGPPAGSPAPEHAGPPERTPPPQASVVP
jgi:hypothetical protein